MLPEEKHQERKTHSDSVVPVSEVKVIMKPKPSRWRTMMDFTFLPVLGAVLVAQLHDLLFADKVVEDIESHLEKTTQTASKSKTLLSDALKFLQRQNHIYSIGVLVGIAMGAWGYIAGKSSERQWDKDYKHLKRKFGEDSILCRPDKIHTTHTHLPEATYSLAERPGHAISEPTAERVVEASPEKTCHRT